MFYQLKKWLNCTVQVFVFRKGSTRSSYSFRYQLDTIDIAIQYFGVLTCTIGRRKVPETEKDLSSTDKFHVTSIPGSLHFLGGWDERKNTWYSVCACTKISGNFSVKLFGYY